MTTRVKIPTQLRPLAGDQAEMEIDGASTIRDLMDSLTGSHPDLVERILGDDGQLRRFVNLYLGDEDVRFLDGLETKLDDGSVLTILPAVAGGS